MECSYARRESINEKFTSQMNKVLNINLGGYPFTIDLDAYAMLEDYLQTIEHHFHDSEGCDEIIADIENRMAELFNEELGKRGIVGEKDVQRAIAIMGTPEDFGAEPMEAGPKKSKRKTKSSRNSDGFKFGKKLFRDPEDTQVGGVCSGLAAYFGIEDPLWVRLGFILFGLSGGIAVPLYFILWAITKEAKSPSDRLAMTGEKINVSNIGKKVEEEMERFSEKMNEWGESEKWNEWTDKEKWKSAKKKFKDEVKKKMNQGIRAREV